MTKLLLCYFSLRTDKKRVCTPCHFPFKRILQYLGIALTLLMGGQTYGQNEVDTWYSADRAVNTPSPDGNLQLYTPFAPTDNTPVTTWYDLVDYAGVDTKQHAVQHPADPAHYPNPWDAALNPGFAHSFGLPAFLSPTGSVPGIPTLRRNDMNFNPSVEFDGSGNGQALHTRSISREEITVFIVFRAPGAGNTARTQRLLYGGDIDNYHNSTTNLSLGVSDGNRFSVGRTRVGATYFQSGGIDLLERPTIGVFSRATAPLGDSEEILKTKVNGIQDINTTRSDINNIAEDDLYLFVRLGKHFNSNDPNTNLTGNIAEVLVADTTLAATYIQRAESYLAIKYGITLNDAGQLGSIDGNQGYQYLSANGTVIWDPAIDPAYRFDIAGLARDRYQDNIGGASPDLRYNLHQRIAKSENAEAIVTMSTNSNFVGDNLDQTRPEIDNTTWGATSLFSFLHNYLLWANDRASLDTTNVELPISGDITTRISREWRIQATRSHPNISPISNVSVRIDLSSSNILTKGDCGLKLLIDTDGDGDFTTGPITMIDATSVDMAGNAYFDNVNFEHLDVFTVGFGDIVPPTASNPADITVCDTPPPADPIVVDDEADNCAIASVVLFSESSDGNTNPETITRTYRVTDTSGNFVDVTQTIYVYLSPDIDDISDQVVCDSFTLPAITGTNLTGSEAYYSGSGGTGTQFAPSDNITVSGTYYIYDETGTTPNCFDEESFTVTVNTSPVAPIANNLTFCDGDSPTGNDLVPAISASITWYSDPALTTVVNGGDALSQQNYYVTDTQGGCESAPTTVTVTITEQPDAGSNGAISICEGDALTQADLFALLGGTPDIGGTWSPAFVGPGVYTYTVPATAPCTTDATATVTVSQQQRPDAGTDGSLTICEGASVSAADLFAQLGGTPDGAGTWSPAPAGEGVYTYTVAATAPCTTDATAEVTVTEQPMPDAGIDATLYICEGDTISAEDLFSALGGTPDNGGDWSPTPAGPGVYTYTVAANGDCSSSTMAQVTVIEENIGAFVEPVYSCSDNNLLSNSILVTFVDPSVNENLMFALDSTDSNDFRLSPNFNNISPGEHSLFIMNSNGCLFEHLFTIDDIEPLELSLSSENVNEITANVTGGSAPYTYYFDNEDGSSNNTYTIDRDGTFFVRVMDRNGCEATASITLNLIEIHIPDFFTPNFDGQNDFWAPRNTEAFPNIQTYIFDRYGRKIQILGQSDAWNGSYESKPLPSGDYWYIVKLNDGSGREFVGHFTLYR